MESLKLQHGEIQYIHLSCKIIKRVVSYRFLNYLCFPSKQYLGGLVKIIEKSVAILISVSYIK